MSLNNNYLQIYILSNKSNQNKDYSKIFNHKNGFNNPVFLKSKKPPKNWIRHRKDYMSKREYGDLYNHYQIWSKCSKQNQKILVIYDQTYFVESNNIAIELVKAGKKIKDCDILFYGKYLDKCDQYEYDRTIIITDHKNVYQYPIYRTFGPYGMFAYLINPSGAGKLIRETFKSPAAPEILVNRLSEKRILKSLVFHPSIIRIFDPHHEMFGYECRELQCSPDCWTWGSVFWHFMAILFLILLLIAVFYFLSSKTDNKPEQMINSGYTENPKSGFHGTPYYSNNSDIQNVVSNGVKPTYMI